MDLPEISTRDAHNRLFLTKTKRAVDLPQIEAPSIPSIDMTRPTTKRTFDMSKSLPRKGLEAQTDAPDKFYNFKRKKHIPSLDLSKSLPRQKFDLSLNLLDRVYDVKYDHIKSKTKSYSFPKTSRPDFAATSSVEYDLEPIDLDLIRPRTSRPSVRFSQMIGRKPVTFHRPRSQLNPRKPQKNMRVPHLGFSGATKQEENVQSLVSFVDNELNRSRNFRRKLDKNENDYSFMRQANIRKTKEKSQLRSTRKVKKNQKKDIPTNTSKDTSGKKRKLKIEKIHEDARKEIEEIQSSIQSRLAYLRHSKNHL
ncbi:hypothetical protein PCE1_003507 [Barthelona sp. PCE]